MGFGEYNKGAERDIKYTEGERMKLTPEQIKNWRNTLVGVIGPYALIMPDEEVQKIRDEMQSNLDEEKDK